MAGATDPDGRETPEPAGFFGKFIPVNRVIFVIIIFFLTWDTSLLPESTKGDCQWRWRRFPVLPRASNLVCSSGMVFNIPNFLEVEYMKLDSRPLGIYFFRSSKLMAAPTNSQNHSAVHGAWDTHWIWRLRDGISEPRSACLSSHHQNFNYYLNLTVWRGL